MALLLARELGLHYLDHPSDAGLANSAEAEMGRRVWWYLIASDWLLAAKFNGAPQGVYQCHIRQMVVKKPLNINDEDVLDGMGRAEQPLSQPTVMSYSLQRIRLSEISRSTVDRTPLIMAHAGGPSHDLVMDIDTELQLLINDIPPFFSMSITTLTESYQLDLFQAGKISHQGYMIHSLLYTQRCKLHFPYFRRGFMDATYASSREAYLQSARLIIQTESHIEKSGICRTTRYRFIGLLWGVFMAIIVLFVDLCHNKSSLQQEQRRGEITDASRILEEARHESDTAAKFMNSLMHILHKHKVSVPRHGGQQSLAPGASSEQLSTAQGGGMAYNAFIPKPCGERAVESIPIASPSVLESGMTEDRFSNGDDFSSYFNELAQSLEEGTEVGSIDWNDTFTGLESSFM